MSESESGAERNLDPTEKRIREAREKGQIARSRELNTAAVTIAAAAALLMSGRSGAMQLEEIFRNSLRLDPRMLEHPAALTQALGTAISAALMAIAPILATAAVAAMVAPMALGGWVFSPTAFMPDFSRLNPITGMGRIFSQRGLVELGKALLKLLVVGSIAYAITRSMMGQMLSLGSLPVEISIGHASTILGQGLLWMSCGLLLIAAVDAPYQWWSFNQQLKMSREEIREEMKEQDGRPEVKAKIRKLSQQYAKRRMIKAIPTADVVITNPTHYAVALKYDPAKDRAPRVVAKGRDLMALDIRRIATEHNVPVFEAPPLARAIYGSTELDAEVPQGLYVAVAQVLSYVFQIKTLTAHRAARLRRPVPQVGAEFEKFVENPDRGGRL